MAPVGGSSEVRHGFQADGIRVVDLVRLPVGVEDGGSGFQKRRRVG